MHKLFAFAAAALVVAVPAPGYCCINGTYIDDHDIRVLKDAERLLAAGSYRMALEAIERYPYWRPEEMDGDDVAAFVRRARLLDATANLRLLAREQPPIDAERLARVTRKLRALQPDDGSKPPLLRARLAEALVLSPRGMKEAKLLMEDLVARDVMPEAEGWVTVAKIRGHVRDYAGMSAALDRCEKMVAKERRAVCRGGGPTS